MKVIQTTAEAIQQVTENNPTDYQLIYAFAEAWVKLQMKSFTAEDLKAAYYKAGNPVPKKVNVFGAVFYNLSKNNAITLKDYTTAALRIAHSRVLRVWISREFRLRQQQNAKVPHPEFNFNAS